MEDSGYKMQDASGKISSKSGAALLNKFNRAG
jgi:hypothetical protein